MRRRISATIGLGAACWASLAAALGLGDIDVRSGLNQPFNATIPLLAIDPEEVDSLSVVLADNHEFERLGIERADYLSHLRFEVQPGRNPIIAVQGMRPAREPFLTFLLDVRAGSSRILREYTVLLDPPTLATAGVDAADAEVAARQSSVSASAPPSAGATSQGVPRATFVPVAPGTVVSTPAPAVTPTPTPAPAELAADVPDTTTATTPITRYGPIVPGETFWSIAVKVVRSLEGVTVNQVLLGLYQQNPQAFDRGRFDGLMKGRTLQVPSRESLTAISDEDATRQVLALRRASPAVDAAAPTSTPTPRPTPTPAPATPPPTPVPDVVETTTDAGEAGIDGDASPMESTAATDTASGQDADVDAAAGDVSDPLADDPVVDDAPAATGDDSRAARLAEIMSTPEPTVAPTATPIPSPPPAPSRPGVMDALMWPLVGLALLVLLVVALVVRRRRKGTPERHPPSVPAAPPMRAAGVAAAAGTGAMASEAAAAADEAEAAVMAAYAQDAGATKPVPAATDTVPDFDATQVFDAPPASGTGKPIPDNPDFEATAQFDVDTVQIDLNAQDPVAEADIHLAYGLYDEAALTLRAALEKAPEDGSLHAKLAEVYFTAGRPLEFVEAAEAARPHVSEADWQKLVVFGQQVAPESALFADAGEGAAALDTDLDLSFDDAPSSPADTGEAAPAGNEDNRLDFDLALDASAQTEAAAPDAAPAAAPDTPGDNVLDFQLEDIDAILPDDTAASPTPTPVEHDPASTMEFNLDDFDVDNALAEVPETPSSSEGNSLDFDIGLPEVAPEVPPTPTAEPPQADDPAPPDHVEPLIDVPPVADTPAVAPMELDLDEFDLGVDSLPPAAGGEAGPPAVDEATIEEFQLDDFELETDSDAISAGDEAGTKLDLARAYVDMGDNEMARVLLDEVLGQGSEAQQTEARALIARLG
jgi:pilus assembly protein FimV